MKVNSEESNFSIVNIDNSLLTIEIYHSRLYGKLFKNGAVKLVYILLCWHLFNSLLSFSISNNFLALFLASIYHFIFSCIEIQFIILILYSYFGSTRISINKQDFLIKKSLWGFKREITVKTEYIFNAEIKPIEVFHSQNKFSLFFDSQENIPYACYLLKNEPDFAFEAMCSKKNLNQILLSINSFINSDELNLASFKTNYLLN